MIRNIAVISLIGCLALAFGYFLGEKFPWKEQEPLYAMLRNAAYILFGILGAWFAVVFPFAHSEGNPAHDQTKRFIEMLCPALDHVIYLIVLTLLAPFCAAIAKNFTYLMPTQTIFTFRKASFAFLFFLLFYQIVILLLVLRPFDLLKRIVTSQIMADEAKNSYTPQKYQPNRYE